MQPTHHYLTHTQITLLTPTIGVDEHLLNQREVETCLSI